MHRQKSVEYSIIIDYNHVVSNYSRSFISCSQLRGLHFLMKPHQSPMCDKFDQNKQKSLSMLARTFLLVDHTGIEPVKVRPELMRGFGDRRLYHSANGPHMARKKRTCRGE